MRRNNNPAGPRPEEQDHTDPLSRQLRSSLGLSRRPLVSLFIAAIIPLLLFGGWVAYITADQQREQARRRAFETVNQVAERIASEMDAQLQVVETLAASTALDDPSLQRFYTEAQRVKATHPLWETIELTDPSGTQLVNLLRPLGVRLGPTADRESFDEVIKTGQSAIGGIGPVGPISGKRLVAIRAPVVRQGQLIYVITVSFIPNAISEILAGAGVPNDWVGAVVDARGNFIARTLAQETELGRPAAPGLREAIQRAPAGFYVSPTLEGVEVEVVYRTLPKTGGWSVHLGVPSDALNTPVLRSVYILAGGGVASCLLALLLASLMARDIAQRRQTEAERASLALALSEERGAVAIEAAELGTWRWEVGRGKFFGSERCWTILNLPPGDISGPEGCVPVERFLEVIHEEDRDAIQAAAHRCLEDSSTMNVEVRVRRHDGSLNWIRATGRALDASAEGPPEIHGVIADIEPEKRAQAERLNLLRRLAEAQENEQRRIARELHDQIGQTVTGLSLGLKALEHKVDGGGAQEHVRWLQALTSEIGRDIHRAAADLRPTSLDDLGLRQALIAFTSDWGDRFGIKVDIQFVGVDDQLPPEVGTVVYRIVQEAFTNILKHASARNVSVVVERRSQRLRMIIEDDGAGFKPDTPAELAAGGGWRDGPPLGLSGARERLSLVGGTLEIESAPGKGTTLFIQIPLSHHEQKP
ncbi:PAS domain-containing protein [Microvirga sp. BT688]|nr:PAS domain-containing protein [Microvirga sp.]